MTKLLSQKTMKHVWNLCIKMASPEKLQKCRFFYIHITKWCLTKIWNIFLGIYMAVLFDIRCSIALSVVSILWRFELTKMAPNKSYTFNLIYIGNVPCELVSIVFVLYVVKSYALYRGIKKKKPYFFVYSKTKYHTHWFLYELKHISWKVRPI